MNSTVDINCDLGEGIANEAKIMEYINSCNIACGGHYGDLQSTVETLELAQSHHLKVGAHPSYPDKENFGRKIVDISEDDLSHSIAQQIITFKQACEITGSQFHHVKLHGALYNQASKDPATAELVINVFRNNCPDVIVYTPWRSILALKAKAKFKVYYEAFIDRRYHSNLQLVSRDRNDAVITDPQEALNQMLQLLEKGSITSVEGKIVRLLAKTYCVHGDQEKALELLQFINSSIPIHG